MEEAKKPMSTLEMGRFGRKRDADFRKIENALDQRYIFSKMKASAEIKKIFEDSTFREYYLKLEKLSEDHGVACGIDHGLLEVATMRAKGDNGFGYYDFSLMLSIANFRRKNYSGLIYIAVQYKPADKEQYPWETTEFEYRDTSNFSPRIYFLDLLKQFTQNDTALLELKKLAARPSAFCLKERTHFVTE